MIRYRDGVDVEPWSDALGADWEVERIEPPVRIVDLAQIRNLPLVLAGAAAVLGIGLLAHALVVTVRRRGSRPGPGQGDGGPAPGGRGARCWR